MRYRIRSSHRKGRGIHSPFAFKLLSKVVYDGDKVEQPVTALKYHAKMLESKHSLKSSGHGAGSRITRSSVRSVSSIARSSSVSRKQGLFLHRLVSWYQAEVILELGTGLGISTAYLASGAPKAALFSVEGDPERSAFARDQLQSAGIINISLYHASFESCLEALLEKLADRSIAFIDGDHRYEPTVNTVHSILDKGLSEMIIILDDIHWSNEMQRAWRFLREDDRISLSVDLFFMGILVIRPGMQKQHFIVTF